MLLPLLGLRFLQPEFSDKIAFGVDEERLRAGQLRRIWNLNERFFGVPLQIAAGIPYVWTALAAIIGVTRFKASVAARWTIVTTVVIASVIFPLTGPLWTLAVPASQLWRVLWIAPFGIAGAFLLQFGLDWIAPRVRWERSRLELVVLPVLALLLLAGAYGNLMASGDWRNLHTLRLPKNARGDYADLVALGSVLGAQLAVPTVIVGGDKWLNDRLPALTGNARVFVMRSKRSMWELGNLTTKDAKERWQDWQALSDEDTDAAERYEILKERNVRYVLAAKGTKWVDELVAAEPARFEQVGSAGALKLWRVKLD